MTATEPHMTTWAVHDGTRIIAVMEDRLEAQQRADQLDEQGRSGCQVWEQRHCQFVQTTFRVNAQQIVADDVGATKVTNLMRRLMTIADMHRPKGARCEQCGVVWPCPTREMTDAPVDAY